MTTKEQIEDKIDLYDAMVALAESEYNVKRDRFVLEALKAHASGEKTVDQLNVEAVVQANEAKAEMNRLSGERLPLLREIRKDIDSFSGELTDEFWSVLAVCAVHLGPRDSK